MLGDICASGLRQISQQLITATNNCMWNILTSTMPLFTYDYRFRLIYSPGQLFALCFTSENKITGLLLVTYKYRGEVIVKLKETERKEKKRKRSFVFLRCHGFESRREIVSCCCCCCWFFSLFYPSFHAYCISPERNSIVWKRLGHWDLKVN